MYKLLIGTSYKSLSFSNGEGIKLSLQKTIFYKLKKLKC
jgi:hypothetical protein